LSCSGMFRNVPGCSMFQILSTPQLNRQTNKQKVRPNLNNCRIYGTPCHFLNGLFLFFSYLEEAPQKTNSDLHSYFQGVISPLAGLPWSYISLSGQDKYFRIHCLYWYFKIIANTSWGVRRFPIIYIQS